MAPPNVVDQLAIVTVSGPQAGTLITRLNQDEFYVTRIDTSGGILYEATVALLIGFDQARQSRLLEHIRECCPTQRRFIPAHAEAPMIEVQPAMIEAEVGGATIYILEVERFVQL